MASELATRPDIAQVLFAFGLVFIGAPIEFLGERAH
jgi:hypothetical protein